MKIGFMGLLTLLFIALKLLGIISWSWWIVLLPAYGIFSVVILLSLIAVVVGLLKLPKELKKVKK